MGGMNDLVKQELTENIVLALLAGENPDKIQTKFSCDYLTIVKIMDSSAFSERVKEFLEKDIQISGLMALKNIKKIACDDNISRATQLKANQWIAEKALELGALGAIDDSPATMTQDQLARRLKDLQNEALRRAQPINTGVIDHAPGIALSDLLD